MLKPHYSQQDVEIIEKSTVFKGFFQFDRYRVKHRKFAGGWSETVQRELFERGHAVAVMLYDPDRETVVLVEQIRIGALAGMLDNDVPASPWLFEVVAGMVEPGETQEAVAMRECQEESGCVPSALHSIARYWPSPGACSETIQLYCGIVDSAGVSGIHGVDGEHEDIQVHVIPFDEAYRGIESGLINNSATIIGLQWLQIHRHSL